MPQYNPCHRLAVILAVVALSAVGMPGLAEEGTACEAERAQSVQRLGFDPWAAADPQTLDRAWLQRVIVRLTELKRCVETKEGVPLDRKPELDLATSTHEERVALFGFDPLTDDPERIVQGLDFWPRAKRKLRELILRCGAPDDLQGIEQSLNSCTTACSVSYQACNVHCREFAPPEPSCLDSCDWRFDFCNFICWPAV